MRILLAEDDQALCEALHLALSHKGYTVDAANNGLEAAGLLRDINYDLLVLDLGLPGLDGRNVLSQMRAEGQTIPVIVITARDGIEDRIDGLDRGANDYLTKPFDIRELEARIRAALRNKQWENRLEIRHNNLSFITHTKQVFIDDEPIELTPREMAILELLLQKPGSLISKQKLIDHISTWDLETTENAIEIVVHRLRKKLSNAEVVIRTVRGFGYLLEKPL